VSRGLYPFIRLVWADDSSNHEGVTAATSARIEIVSKIAANPASSLAAFSCINRNRRVAKDVETSISSRYPLRRRRHAHDPPNRPLLVSFDTNSYVAANRLLADSRPEGYAPSGAASIVAASLTELGVAIRTLWLRRRWICRRR
jgi:hypothetical protein